MVQHGRQSGAANSSLAARVAGHIEVAITVTHDLRVSSILVCLCFGKTLHLGQQTLAVQEEAATIVESQDA